MATSSHSFMLPVDKEQFSSSELPLDEEAITHLLNLCGEDGYVYHSSPHYHVQTFLHDFCVTHQIVGLEYVNQPQSILAPDSILRAIEGFSYLLWFFEHNSDETAEFLDGELYSGQVKEAVGLDVDQLSQSVDFEDENFYRVLIFIRMQLSVLQEAMGTNRHLLHVLLDYDPDRIHWLSERGPHQPIYSKQLLAEMENILEHGVDTGAFPFPCPTPRSMIYGQAREWYRSMMEKVPALTSHIDDEASRHAAAKELGYQLGLVAITSLCAPNLAPKFFVTFVQGAAQG